MNALAGFIMRGRTQGILAIALLTILSWALSLASLLAAAALALPTLRRGGKEGLLLAAGALPAVALVGQFLLGNALQAGGYALALWLPVLMVAVVLRETASLAMAVVSAMALGLVMVAGIYAVIDNPATYWLAALQQFMQPMLEQRNAGVDPQLMAQTLQAFSRYATGAIAAGSVMTVLISLLLARWWQASLYHPGGFRAEFLQLRLPLLAGYAFLALLALLAVSSGGLAEFAANLLLPGLMVYILAGFAVIHALCSRSATGRFWLVGIYIGLMFVAPLVLLIALTGLSDSWLHWRQRLVPPGGGVTLK